MILSYRLVWSTEPEFEPSYVQFSVARWTAALGDSAPLISPELKSDGEIDAHADLLKRELDLLAVQAKEALRKRQV